MRAPKALPRVAASGGGAAWAAACLLGLWLLVWAAAPAIPVQAAGPQAWSAAAPTVIFAKAGAAPAARPHCAGPSAPWQGPLLQAGGAWPVEEGLSGRCTQLRWRQGLWEATVQVADGQGRPVATRCYRFEQLPQGGGWALCAVRSSAPEQRGAVG